MTAVAVAAAAADAAAATTATCMRTVLIFEYTRAGITPLLISIAHELHSQLAHAHVLVC